MNHLDTCRIGSHDLHPVVTAEMYCKRAEELARKVAAIYLGSQMTEKDRELCGAVFHHITIMFLHSDEGKTTAELMKNNSFFNFNWQIATEDTSGMIYPQITIFIDALNMSLACHNEHYRHRTTKASLMMANEYFLSVIRAYAEICERPILDDTAIELFARAQIVAANILQESLHP